MEQREIEVLATSVMRLAAPGIPSEALMAAVREMHPEASQREVVRAAFYAMIMHADDDPMLAQRMLAFAMEERQRSEDDTEIQT